MTTLFALSKHLKHIRFLVLFAFLTACSQDDELSSPLFEPPKTTVQYEVVLQGMPDDETQELAEESLAVYRHQDDGAQSLAFLRRRAESDVETIGKILRSRGYYRSETTVEVARTGPEPEVDATGTEPGAGTDASDTAEDTEPGTEEETTAQVTIKVDPGPVFTLARHDLKFTDTGLRAPPPLSAEALGSPVGKPAQAAAIVDAETAAVARLQQEGYPYTEKGNRRAVADLENASIEIDTPLSTGPYAAFGPVTFTGLADVDESYLRTYLPWKEGEVFDTEDLREYQSRLLGTNLFDSVAVRPPEKPPAEGESAPTPLPITVSAEERLPRTVKAGFRYNTDTGPALSGGFEHRNLWGANETLNIEAEAGFVLQQIGIGFTKPQFLRDQQKLTSSLLLRHEDDDAFEDYTASATVGLERRLTPRWIVGIGGLAEASDIKDDVGKRRAYLGGFPGYAEYDSTDDALDPTLGQRLRMEATPIFGSFNSEFIGFLGLDSRGSAYYDILGDKRFVLAGRGRIASIISDELDDIPPTRRLYSGGGGSVRGYEQRFIGPINSENDPTGGRSAVELGAELRAKVYGDLGIVTFVDAGSVSEKMFPDFDERVQVAVGGGLRYYSPAGPIRVDVAFPVNGRAVDDSFQLYFSIGQAF